MTYKEIATSKYASYPGNASLVFDAICKTLTKRGSEVDWPKFTDDDWHLLTVMAKTEGVAPLLYDVLKGTEDGRRETVPPPIHKSLVKEYYATAAYNTLLFSELDRILTALNAAGTCPEQSRRIPVILLKGAALALTLYPDPALRPMGDLDFLVPEKELDRCEEIAHELEYAYEPHVGGTDLRKLVNYEINFDGGKHFPAKIEFHWDLIAAKGNRQYHPRISWFWDQAVQSPVNDGQFADLEEVSTLTPEAHLLYLSAHLKHKHMGRERLLWYYDLFLLFRRYGECVRWDKIIAAAEEFGWEDFLLAAIHDLQNIFDVKLDGEIARRISSPEFINHLAAIDRSKSNRAVSVFASLSRLTWPARLRLALALIFPTPSYIRFRYQIEKRWKTPFFYFYRWGDMAGEAAKYFFG